MVRSAHAMTTFLRAKVGCEGLGELLDKVYQVQDSDVIPARDKPHRQEGGTVVLYGNLAPEGSVLPELAHYEDFVWEQTVGISLGT